MMRTAVMRMVRVGAALDTDRRSAGSRFEPRSGAIRWRLSCAPDGPAGEKSAGPRTERAATRSRPHAHAPDEATAALGGAARAATCYRPTMSIDLTYPPLLRSETLPARIDWVNECVGGGHAIAAAFERR